MRLLNDSLYDLYTLFTFLRNFPDRFPRYRNGIRQIAALIADSGQEIAPLNAIRHCLRPCYDPADIGMHRLTVDEAFEGEVPLAIDEAYHALLSAMLREMLAHGDNPDRLSLLCDALHNIPAILIRQPHPRSHILVEIAHYQKLYNPEFLMHELNTLR